MALPTKSWLMLLTVTPMVIVSFLVVTEVDDADWKEIVKRRMKMANSCVHLSKILNPRNNEHLTIVGGYNTGVGNIEIFEVMKKPITIFQILIGGLFDKLLDETCKVTSFEINPSFNKYCQTSGEIK
ncbi:hypothetical protein HELRODRAFT_171196 [Helobdella robusta]|uniref:Uncharacterized protein n=1 Tax=Helobdella robusta TaxID=6412 RepID=T1F3X4_HELRO|nr:hypothetical protein HELRODRAFT_171196 [Helobdella robusta]ESO05556.1 hypothetical protein HELRODRAFT_171196 [Helobdella robusta]